MSIVLAAYAAATLLSIWASERCRRAFNSQAVEDRDANESRFELYAVLPAYQATEIITQSISHFASITPKFTGIIVLLSEGDLPTIERATEAAARISEASVEILICPHTCSSKSKKLEHCWSTVSLKSKAFYCIFDIDSRVEEDFIRKTNVAMASEPEIEIWQPLPVVDYQATASFVSSSLALGHIERAVFEAAVLLSADKTRSAVPLGLMGACVLIRGEAISRLRPWPSHSDDIQIGYRAHQLGVRRRLLPVRVKMQPCVGFLEWWRQQLRIAHGVQTRSQELSPLGTVASVVFDTFAHIRSLLFLTALQIAVWGSNGIESALTAILLAAFCSVRMRRALFRDELRTPVKFFLLTLLAAALWAPLRIVAGFVSLLGLPRAVTGDVLTTTSTKRHL